MQNALSIDVEEHFQVHGLASTIERDEWELHESRVVTNTRRILSLLRQYDTRATFFVLGWVADRHPSLVGEIAGDGHEVASHGYGHELIYHQSPAQFADDVERARIAIRSALTTCSVPSKFPTIGYRAPAFSVTRQSLWALDILSDLGVRYDSSIFPLAVHDRYGIGDAGRFATRLQNDLWEFPVSTLRLGARNWPVAGGGYFRLFPLWVTQIAIRRINREGHPAVIYLHPWEFDPQQPRVRNVPFLSRFRHYVNLHKTEQRLRTLLQEFKFAPVAEVFSAQLELS